MSFGTSRGGGVAAGARPAALDLRRGLDSFSLLGVDSSEVSITPNKLLGLVYNGGGGGGGGCSGLNSVVTSAGGTLPGGGGGGGSGSDGEAYMLNVENQTFLVTVNVTSADEAAAAREQHEAGQQHEAEQQQLTPTEEALNRSLDLVRLQSPTQPHQPQPHQPHQPHHAHRHQHGHHDHHGHLAAHQLQHQHQHQQHYQQQQHQQQQRAFAQTPAWHQQLQDAEHAASGSIGEEGQSVDGFAASPPQAVKLEHHHLHQGTYVGVDDLMIPAPLDDSAVLSPTDGLSAYGGLDGGGAAGMGEKTGPQLKRQERNRIAARRSREKKKEYVIELEQKVKVLTVRNKEVTRELKRLRREMADAHLHRERDYAGASAAAMMDYATMLSGPPSNSTSPTTANGRGHLAGPMHGTAGLASPVFSSGSRP